MTKLQYIYIQIFSYVRLVSRLSNMKPFQETGENPTIEKRPIYVEWGIPKIIYKTASKVGENPNYIYIITKQNGV